MLTTEISRTENGFLLLASSGLFSYESDDVDEFGDLRAMQKALYQIIEEHGLLGSKHDAKRLRVVIVDNNEEIIG